jgi:hypothetical protein
MSEYIIGIKARDAIIPERRSHIWILLPITTTIKSYQRLCGLDNARAHIAELITDTNHQLCKRCTHIMQRDKLESKIIKQVLIKHK